MVNMTSMTVLIKVIDGILGYINRNGFGITKQAMQQGFLDAFGMDFTVTSSGAENAINQCSRITGKTCTSFDLNQLDIPHTMEHDGSLSRLDKQMQTNQNADSQQFNQATWDKTLAIYGASTHIGLKFANSARIKRNQQAQADDFPGWFSMANGAPQAENAFILSSMNDPAMGVNLNTPGANPQARVDWTNYWISKCSVLRLARYMTNTSQENMELPTALGWKKPTQVVTGNNIASLMSAIDAAPTVTANVGTSPFIARRKRSTTEPEPSYNLELNERALEEHYASLPLEKRRKVPIQAVPAIESNPTTAPEVSSAKAHASAVAGPPPVLPNPYFEVLSPEQWVGVSATVQNYTATYQNALTDALGQTLPPL